MLINVMLIKDKIAILLIVIILDDMTFRDISIQ